MPTPRPLEGSARHALAATFAALAFALAFQGARPLWDPDEGRYVDVALEMLRTGDWWTPHLHHDVPHFAKPPLTYWLIASAIGALGRSEWAVRLPMALAFAGTILVVHRLARHVAARAETTAAVVYATSLLPFVAANIVTTDTLLSGFSALAALGLLELWRGDGSASRARFLFYAGAGLAFLTKGPPALLPIVGLLAGGAVTGEAFRGPRRLLSLPGLAGFGVLAFAWYAHEIVQHPDLLAYWLGHEVFARVGSDEFGRHSGWLGLFGAYGPVLLGGLLPWWPLALFVRRRDPALDRRSALLLWIWLAGPLAIFATVQSRLPLYLLPLAVPGALLVARRLGPLPARSALRVVAGVAAIALLCAKLAFAVLPHDRDGERFARELLALYPAGPGEVIFVDSQPRYSLAFYLDREVEEVDLVSLGDHGHPPAYGPVSDLLPHELSEPEAHRVFLVPGMLRGAFLRELAAFGRRCEPLGSLRGYQVFGPPEPTSPATATPL